MDWYLLFFFFIVGIFSGFAAGFFGIGGGIITIPILLWVFESTNIGGDYFVHLAFGTNLFIIIFTASLASYRHTRNKKVYWHAVPFIALFSIAGAFLGAGMANFFSGVVLKYIFVALLIFTGFQLLLKKKEKMGNRQRTAGSEKGGNRLFQAMTGLSAGFISGITGLGGGIVTIPLLINLLKYPIKVVAGTSSSIMIFTAAAATIGYVVQGWQNSSLPSGAVGYVYLTAAVPIMISAAIFTQLGAQANHLISKQKLRIGFAFLLFAVSLKLLFF